MSEASPTTPPGWATTDHPMTVAILGWARLPMQNWEGSGYNLSASELAAGLTMSGHRVHYLASGMRYTPRRRPFIARTMSWRGVECHALFNSPNLSPAFFNFENLAREVNSPDQSRLVLRWLEDIKAEVVHIHALEGYSLDLIGAIRDSGRPVIVTPHNHWYVCPQVDLLYKEREVCMDFEGGRRCVGCLSPGKPGGHQTRRRLGQFWEGILGRGLVDTFKNLPVMLKGRPRRGGISRDGLALPVLQGPRGDVALGFDPAPESHGLVDHGPLSPAVEPPPLGRSPIDQNERFLAAGHHRAEANDYGRRRGAGIEALNRASLVTPPSDFLRRILVTMGVEEGRTRAVRLGQPHFDQIHRRAVESPFYGERPWDALSPTRPLRLAFFGTTRNNKGLDVLARAIPLLDKPIRQKCQFLIRGAGPDWAFRRRMSPYPEVNLIGGYDLIHLVAAMGEFDVGILPHIWFENSPLVLLEFLHAGKFVISSRLGGPPEWIIEPGSAGPGYNGLMFPAGDSEALAACISNVVSGKVQIPSGREIHRVTPNLQSYPGHVAEVEGIYREAVRGPAPAAEPAAQPILH